MRPAGLPPSWATTVNYPAGTDDWSGSSTKVDPGTTKVANGFLPGERIAAEHLNFELNRFAQFVTYLDTIEARNWTQQVEVDVRTNVSFNALEYDEANQRFWLGGTSRSGGDDEAKLFWSLNGIDWAEEGSVPTRPMIGALQTIQIAPSVSGILLSWDTTNGKSWFAFRATNGTWTTSTNQPADIIATFAIYNDTSTKWEIFGHRNGSTQPRIWTVTNTDIWVESTLTSASSHLGLITLAAIKPASSTKIAINSTGGVWKFNLIAAAWQFTASPFASTPKGLTWWDAEGVFLVVCTGGEVYSSDDGASWTLRTTVSGVSFDGCTSGPGGLTAIGGLVVSPCVIDTANGGIQQVLAIGWDLGQSWDSVSLPVVDPSLGVGGSRGVQSLVFMDRRLGILRRAGSTSGEGARVTFGMRVQ